MRHIEIEWVGLGRRITAELLPDKNPELCQLLWDSLPYNSLQNHALVSGHHLYHLAPIARLVHTPGQTYENRTQSPDGTVFLSQLQHLAVKYGELTEPLVAAAIGRVLEQDMSVLREAGRELWRCCYETKQAVEVRVTRQGEPASTFSLPVPPAGPGPVGDLIRAIHDETQRVWVTAPEEIVDLHAGRVRSGAGSYGQYFSTLVFVNGETRPLGYDACGGLVKTCATSDLTLAQLVAIMSNFIKVPAEFLGYCGLETLWGFVRRALELRGEIQTKDEFYWLLATLGLYGNCLNAWNLHYFPWRHGTDYPL